LVDVQKIKAGEKYQYWRADESSYTYLPSNSSLIKNMKSVFSGKQKSINLKLKEEFSWKNSANKIINIYENFSK
jgi:hypothetical protein